MHVHARQRRLAPHRGARPSAARSCVRRALSGRLLGPHEIIRVCPRRAHQTKRTISKFPSITRKLSVPPSGGSRMCSPSDLSAELPHRRFLRTCRSSGTPPPAPAPAPARFLFAVRRFPASPPAPEPARPALSVPPSTPRALRRRGSLCHRRRLHRGSGFAGGAHGRSRVRVHRVDPRNGGAVGGAGDRRRGRAYAERQRVLPGKSARCGARLRETRDAPRGLPLKQIKDVCRRPSLGLRHLARGGDCRRQSRRRGNGRGCGGGDDGRPDDVRCGVFRGGVSCLPSL